MMTFLQKLKKQGVDVEYVAQDRHERIHIDVDIFENPHGFVLHAQVPGVAPSDLVVTIEGHSHIVVIEGVQERPSIKDKKERPNEAISEECVWGTLYRKIVLPKSVDATQVTAHMEHGVLTLTLPF